MKEEQKKKHLEDIENRLKEADQKSKDMVAPLDRKEAARAKRAISSIEKKKSIVQKSSKGL